jgi:hypothetical protein
MQAERNAGTQDDGSLTSDERWGTGRVAGERARELRSAAGEEDHYPGPGDVTYIAT